MAFTKLDSETLRQHKGKSFVGITTVFYCHDGKGHLLFGKRSQQTRDEQGAWDCGGGGLKLGVSVEDNLRRELLEEYGAEARSIEFLGYRDVFRTDSDGEKTHWLSLTFLVLVNPDEVTNGEPDQIDEIGWFGLNSLPSPLHSQIGPEIEHFKAKLQAALGRIHA